MTRHAVVRVDSRALQRCEERPVLAWVLRELLRFGINEVCLLPEPGCPALPDLGRLPKPVALRVLNVASPRPGDGVAALLAAVKEALPEQFLFCEGGALFDVNLAGLLGAGANRPGARLQLQSWDGGLNNTEMYVLFKDSVCTEPGIEFLPDIAVPGAVGCAADPHRWVSRLRRRALFLDRDGVLNVDHGYVGTRERFEWVENALPAIAYATRAGWHVFIVTNQSGVARGFYDEAAVRDLLDWIAEEARASGGTIDDVRYCPYHPDATVDAYRGAHPWRKPAPGMLLDLLQAWDLDAGQAVMVGDQISDLQAAEAAGMSGHLFRGGDLLAFLRPILQS